jgi:hypothetical protein
VAAPLEDEEQTGAREDPDRTMIKPVPERPRR